MYRIKLLTWNKATYFVPDLFFTRHFSNYSENRKYTLDRKCLEAKQVCRSLFVSPIIMRTFRMTRRFCPAVFPCTASVLPEQITPYNHSSLRILEFHKCRPQIFMPSFSPDAAEQLGLAVMCQRKEFVIGEHTCYRIIIANLFLLWAKKTLMRLSVCSGPLPSLLFAFARVCLITALSFSLWKRCSRKARNSLSNVLA